MKTAEKKAADTMRQLANKNFSLSDLNISFSYTGERQGEKINPEQFSRRFLQEVEKRRGVIC